MRDLARNEFVLEFNALLLTHYLLLTDDQGFDLLSSAAPSIAEVALGSPVESGARNWLR